jgi:YHS domain-containing protein
MFLPPRSPIMEFAVRHLKLSLVALAGLAIIAGFSLTLFADSSPKPPIFTGLIPGVAAGGFDPVAYHTNNKAVPGRPDITLSHGGAVWRFASTSNRDAFKTDPIKYAPQYGGYCAYAVASGYTAKGDPEQWTIIGQKLYFNYDAATKAKWLTDTAGYIIKSDANWPGVLAK